MRAASPSAQLQSELRHAIHSALDGRRPVLHHLNSDTTWLLQIPRPHRAIQLGGRFYFNILLDPWLQGGQSDVASWFSQQFHATRSSVTSIKEVERIAYEAEMLAYGNEEEEEEEHDLGRRHSEIIDAVCVSHEFTDHCHKDTLLEVHPDVPVFATREAAQLIESWKHFRTVVTLNTFGQDGETDWRSTSLPPLPEWLGISRLLSTDDQLNYHSALLITWNNRHSRKSQLARTELIGRRKRGSHHSTIEPDEDDENAEGVVYSPHGIRSDDLSFIPQASPEIKTVAFLHGLHNVRIGTASGRTALQLNLGAHNGLKAQRLLQASFWIGTHDAIKKGGGLVSWFLQRDALTLRDALEQERRARHSGEKVDGDLGDVIQSFDDTSCKWVDVRNGESIILEG